MLKQLVLFLLAVFMAVPIFASEGDEVYTITTDYWPPFRIHDDGNGIVGADTEIMAEVARRMDVTFVWQRRPWARCMIELKAGEADIITGVAKTLERQSYIVYSAIPYYTCSPAFYVKRGYLGFSIVQYKDLKGLSIGLVRDSAYFDQFDKDKTLRKEVGNTEEQLLKMLEEGRLDVIVGTDCQVEYDISKRGLADDIVQTEYRPSKTTDLYVGFSMHSRFLKRLDEFDRVLSDMKREGVIDRIVSKYISKGHTDTK